MAHSVDGNVEHLECLILHLCKNSIKIFTSKAQQIILESQYLGIGDRRIAINLRPVWATY